MFPVVFGVNAIILALASGSFLFYSIVGHNKDLMDGFVKDKFRIDIGTLTFGFTMIWSYASFCQFMLIWAGNLPEEITYYLRRKSEGWEILTWSLVVIHWFVPFVVFYMRQSLRWDFLWAGLCLCGAVYFMFRGTPTGQ